MENTTRFDRYENMDSETREEIMDLIIKFKLSKFGDLVLVNSLYGLFDGYFYRDTLNKYQKVIESEDVTLGIRLANVIKEIETYPEGITEIF